ncbi:MAG: NAD(P)H-dependent oxidoreductase [Anaerolineales bacterium]|nr:NAD(P)H-dependent oxidoreductase [Anaerolineales bacterium]
MKTPKNALLLIGSAKPAGESSSEALGAYVLERLSAQGITTEVHHVARSLRTEARFQEFLAALDRTDLFILAFPLYVDSLPYLVVDALERIAAHRRAQIAPAQTAFLAISNCGFPESQHNATALAICEQFALETGFAWAGGLAIGAGGAIGGRPLTAAGACYGKRSRRSTKWLRHLRKATQPRPQRWPNWDDASFPLWPMSCWEILDGWQMHAGVTP